MAERYDDVRSLSQRELRAMLERGRPEERVWALWALALASAPNDLGALVRRAEPDAGVRRNLAVILAGHGELDLLVALATRDPAPEVRAAAMQLVARFAIDGKLPASLVVERATADGAAAVRIAILGTVFANAPAWLRELARSLLGDPDRDVRYEAFEALVRAGGADAARAIAWLDDASDDEARIAVMRWTARTPGAHSARESRVHACATMLARAGASRRLRRVFVECVRVATWHDVAPIVGDDATLVRAFIQRGADCVQQIPPTTLVAIALREGGDHWILAARDRLATVNVPDLELAPLLADYRERCELRAKDLDGEPLLQEELTLAAELAATLTLH
ncbi:MAG TPA: hypothetical protein VH143_02695 [Kofleriaceae bacterium]|nr:hypothetical protein [Kofleriaceae bacterium]